MYKIKNYAEDFQSFPQHHLLDRRNIGGIYSLSMEDFMVYLLFLPKLLYCKYKLNTACMSPQRAKNEIALL